MRTHISPALRQKANDFLHWREQNGGAVRWDRGGANARRRNRERRIEAKALDAAPVDSFLTQNGAGA
ncbi:hypothetical protein [Kaistia nematophila]|uniref:Uncharacterized protein n=1 Tax=Kaistia nematophila TaxID=2994654 RepID=A0A9X3EE77_9HYPH|nr:hypothetical protein [Kaistia nematophila]MCX5571450.1 hypothetical protein [Kaistia nematophila]